MESILHIDDLPPGQYETMLYEIYITDKAEKYVIHARNLAADVYIFYANLFLENYIKNMSEKKSFVFYNDRTLKSQIKITGGTILL